MWNRIMCGNVCRKFSSFHFCYYIGIMLQSHPSHNIHLIHGYYAIKIGDFLSTSLPFFIRISFIPFIHYQNPPQSFFFFHFHFDVHSIQCVFLYTFAFIVKFIVCLMRQFVVVLNVHNTHLHS